MRAVTFRLLSRKPGPCLCVHQTDAELAYVVKTDKVVTRQQPVGKQRHAAENGQQKQQQQQQQQPTITGATKPAPIVASSPQRVALDGYTVAPPRTGHASGAAPDNTQGASPAVVYPSTPAARQLRQRQPPADRRSESSLTKQAPTHAKKTVANAARGQQPPHVRHAQHGQSSADDELQQQPGVQPQPAAASSSKPRGRHRDPGRAFMNAGIPPGLWVLPVSASADAPPAPPPVAPEDPQALLEVLQRMPPPRRRVVIFKAGGYIYSDLEALIAGAGLSHVLRLTNLIRKAHCVLAKPVWDNGRHVNLAEHQAAAVKARVPFLTIDRLDAVQLVEALRPVLVKKCTVVELCQSQRP